MNHTIELLSPAGNIQIGRSAILAGADAVYIGGDGFGARQAAGNSMTEIEILTKFAHGYGAKVYLTMNTILLDHEIEQAHSQAVQAWEAGVDALIIQDLAYLEMDLPPIALHSSTQMFNNSPEKALLWQELGFERVVLERALTLEEIKAVRNATTVELEAFIHGAICVGYSGQCYLSHMTCGRGGNRGGCAQSCRSNYNVYDKKGSELAHQTQILSVGDLNLSDRIEDLVSAGVKSLKIEGRLKDESYVVNNTAYYNQILRKLGVARSSSGESRPLFVPDPLKTFSRRSTHYFFDDPNALVSAATKSLGESLGTVQSVSGKRVLINGDVRLNNGDGVCWTDAQGQVVGTNVNGTDGQWVILNNTENLQENSLIYRNFDKTFAPSGRDVERRIGVSIQMTATGIRATDGDGNTVGIPFPATYDRATHPDLALRNIQTGLSKSGDTIFAVTAVDIECTEIPFIPSGQLNAMRRDLLDQLLDRRQSIYLRSERIVPFAWPQLGVDRLDYRTNVSNELSRAVYRKLGVMEIEGALELGGEMIGREVLRTRFCIRRERGLCPKMNAHCRAEPLILENNGRRLEARFYCATCEMGLVVI